MGFLQQQAPLLFSEVQFQSFRSFECDIGLQKLFAPLPANAPPDLHRLQKKKKKNTKKRKKKKRCDLEFAISKRSDLRFHSAIFLRFSAEPATRVAILNLRFENASDRDCDFFGAPSFSTQPSPGKYEKKQFTRIFWRAGKIMLCDSSP